MERLPLDADALRVESFAAAAERSEALAFTVGLNCPETNYRTCPHTCAAGC
jgi:hypothetical protein